MSSEILRDSRDRCQSCFRTIQPPLTLSRHCRRVTRARQVPSEAESVSRPACTWPPSSSTGRRRAPAERRKIRDVECKGQSREMTNVRSGRRRATLAVAAIATALLAVVAIGWLRWTVASPETLVAACGRATASIARMSCSSRSTRPGPTIWGATAILTRRRRTSTASPAAARASRRPPRPPPSPCRRTPRS